MRTAAGERLRDELASLAQAEPDYAVRVVDRLLAAATACGASDVHLQPTANGLEVSWRIDGVVQPVAVLPSALAVNIVGRLKVLAELLTYRSDVPQKDVFEAVRETSSAA